MARALTKTVKSVNIGIVKSTEVGTHNILYTFGARNVINSAANTAIKTVVGSTADVSEPWTMTLIVPEKFKFRTLTSVETTTGAITSSFYSTSFDVDGNVIVSFDSTLSLIDFIFLPRSNPISRIPLSAKLRIATSDTLLT